MSSIIQKSFRGMNADVGPHDAPEGTVALAKNVVFRRAGLAEPRNGLYGKLTSELSAIVNVQDMRGYGGGVAVLDDAKLCLVPGSGGSAVAVDEVDTSGEITMPDGYVSSVEFRDNLYLATDKGVMKITSISDTKAEYAGVGANGTEPSAFASVSSTDWLADNYSVGYLTVIRREDANGVITRSRPSNAVHLENDTGGAITPRVDFTQAEGNAVADSDVIEVYRTISVPGSVAPDTFYFAFEFVAASSNPMIVDDVAEDELGAVLYATDAPASGKPYSGKCLASFAGSLMIANCTGPYSRRIVPQGGVSMRLLYITATCAISTGSPTITVGSETYNPLSADIAVGQYITHVAFPAGTRVTAVSLPSVTASENSSATAPTTPVRFTDAVSIGDGSTTYDIAVTSLANEKIVAGDLEIISLKGVRATVPGSQNSFEGGAILREVSIGKAPGPYSIRSTNGPDIWQNPMPDWDETREDFERDVEPALLMWSLRDKPEMFTPGVGQVYVGDQGKAIWRLVARSDHMLIFKEDGTFVLEGASERSGFRLDRLSDHVIMTPRHACEVDDGVAVWTSDGVVIFSDYGGLRNISSHVVDKYLGRFPKPSDDPAVISGNMFFDSAHNELHLIAQNLADLTSHPDLDAPMHLVWNARTNAWSLWELQSDGAVVGCSPGYDSARHTFMTNKGGAARLWSAVIESEQVVVERAHGDVYEDNDDITVTISDGGTSGINDYTFQHSFTAEALPKVGDMAYSLTDNRTGIIVDVSGSSPSTVTVEGASTPWETGSQDIVVISAFDAEVKLHPKTRKPGTFSLWIQARWELIERAELWKVTVGADSVKGWEHDFYLDSSDTGTEEKTLNTRFSIWSRSFPIHIPSSPRYSFDREHANAMLVQPLFRVSEGGAVWVLSACHIEYVRQSLGVGRA